MNKNFVFVFIFLLIVNLFFNCPQNSETGSSGGGNNSIPGHVYSAGYNGSFYIIIDSNGNNVLNSGEYFASNTVSSIDGNHTITLTYPGDFSQVTVESGTITINVTGANTAHNGDTLYVMTRNREYENSVSINSDDISLTLQDGSGDHIFMGSLIQNIVCFIDENSNGYIDVNEWKSEFTVNTNGNMTEIKAYSTDFTQSSDASGTITINVTGADTSYSGVNLYAGTQDSKKGNSTAISSNDINLILLKNSVSFMFVPYFLYQVGTFIDVNGNGRMDAGDYSAGGSVSVDGNQTVTYAYPANFSEVTKNAGNVTVVVNGALGDHNGSNLYTIAKDESSSNNVTIDSDSFSVLLED